MSSAHKAGLINLENDHEEFMLEQPLEKLKIDQFILPLVILATGSWIAWMIFLGEIIHEKIMVKVGRKQKHICWKN